MKNFDEIIRSIDPKMDYTAKEIANLVGLSYSAILGHIKRESFPVKTFLGRYYINGKVARDYFIK